MQKAPRLPQRILHAHNLPKPQLRFADKVDNSNDLHWSHRLSKKWHSKEISSQMGLMDNEALSITHPYSYEITNLQYNGSLFTSRRPIPPKSFVDTPFSYIDSKEGLFLVLDKLRQAEEIAIDLEHHSYRSYYGFVCLMQISTRNEDIVVDCLVPDIRENLEVLNEVFTDPSKLKASLLSKECYPTTNSGHNRSSTVPSLILFGSKRTSIFTLSIYSTHFMHLKS